MTPPYSRPEVRAVLDDVALDRGGTPSWGWLTWLASRCDAAADAADDDDDDAAADADDADDDDDAAADAADDDDDDDAAAAIRNINHNRNGAEMREGLVLVQVPGRYWGVTRVGWARRVEGDEWEMVGATTVVRTGTPTPLDVLASKGPGKGHRCTPPAALPELLHRFTPRRVLVADESAWAKYVGAKP